MTLPLPGRGQTWTRWRGLADVAAEDLSRGRLFEGHEDAIAILNELGRADLIPGAGDRDRLGVWAAESGDDPLIAKPSGHGHGWQLSGTKQWCSGAHSLAAALVTARAPDGARLFFVDVAGDAIRPVEGTWPAVGMADSDTYDVVFDAVEVGPERAVGGPGDYIGRPGFWHGGIGVAACWFGGAEAVARALTATSPESPHQLAHLGAVQATVDAMTTILRSAAAEVDAAPDDIAAARRRAMTVRYLVERGCTEVLDRVGRATGAGPLCHDAAHARRVADLTVYLRQSHAESDLEALGRLLVGEPR